ncbi:MAG: tRNA lysidine(34) synthetase TilS [Kangiellaceae bacterium]|nr:tRNA lysidine(34) synthetase TilS [Kangiellaceae bacterium]
MSKIEPVNHAIAEFLALSSKKYPENSLTLPFQKYIVALSGGVDSMVLLHALSQQVDKTKILAVYIDHQLQPASAEWTVQNQSFCHSLDVEYHCIKVTVDTTVASTENEARKARYRALQTLINDNDSCLLTAQHQNDQAETFLLQLFRGAGVKGLSSMPYLTNFASGYHARPLLMVAKAEIEKYAQLNKLDYVTDQTNFDDSIRRNFIRNQVLPMIEKRWSSAVEKISQAASHQADVQFLLDELALIDYKKGVRAFDQTIKLEVLQQLSLERQNNLLRYWLEQQGCDMPSRRVLEQIRIQMITAVQDAQPMIELDGFRIRRYQNHIYCYKPQAVKVKITQEDILNWDSKKDLIINGQLIIPKSWLSDNHPELTDLLLTVRLKQSGDKIYIGNRKHGISLKNYFQQEKIAPWLRDRVLVICFEGVIKAIYIID